MLDNIPYKDHTYKNKLNRTHFVYKKKTSIIFIKRFHEIDCRVKQVQINEEKCPQLACNIMKGHN